MLDLLNTLNSLCLVLGIDFKQTVTEVHPSLGNDSEGTKNMSNETIERLTIAIQRLREVKLQRMQRVIRGLISVSSFLKIIFFSNWYFVYPLIL